MKEGEEHGGLAGCSLIQPSPRGIHKGRELAKPMKLAHCERLTRWQKHVHSTNVVLVVVAVGRLMILRESIVISCRTVHISKSK